MYNSLFWKLFFVAAIGSIGCSSKPDGFRVAYTVCDIAKRSSTVVDGRFAESAADLVSRLNQGELLTLQVSRVVAGMPHASGPVRISPELAQDQRPTIREALHSARNTDRRFFLGIRDGVPFLVSDAFFWRDASGWRNTEVHARRPASDEEMAAALEGRCGKPAIAESPDAGAINPDAPDRP